MTYRRRFDILADMVRVAGTGARKTKIMYFANLSFVLLNKYLDVALHVGLLRLSGEEYLATRKGEVFLEKYLEFSNRYSTAKANLERLECEAEALEKMCRPQRAKRRGMRGKGFAVLV